MAKLKSELDEEAVEHEPWDDTSEWAKTRSVLRQLSFTVESLAGDIKRLRSDLRDIQTELRKRRRARRKSDKRSR